MAVQIGNGVIRFADRCIMEASDGTVILVYSYDGSIRVVKDIDSTPTSVDTETYDSIHGGTGAYVRAWAAAIDSNDDIHVVTSCEDDRDRDTAYAVCDLSTGFGSWEEVHSWTDQAPGTNGSVSISIDANDKPHVIFKDYITVKGSTQQNGFYTNRITGSWSTAEQVGVRPEKADFYDQGKISLAPDGDIEAWHYMYDDSEPTRLGTYRRRNGSWGSETQLIDTNYTGDLTVTTGGSVYRYSCYNQWIYENTTWSGDYTALSWKNVVATLIDDSDRYIFFLDTNNNLRMQKNNGTASVLTSGGTTRHMRVEWAYHNFQGGRIHYVYESSTSVLYYDYISFGTDVDSSTDAFIKGKDTGSDSQSAYLAGGVAISSSTDAYVSGGIEVTDTTTAFLKGGLTDSDSQLAFLAGSINVSSFVDAYVAGVAGAIDAIDAFLKGQSVASDSQQVFLAGSLDATDDQLAYLAGGIQETDSCPAFLKGQATDSDSQNAYVRGGSEAIGSTDAYVSGQLSDSDSVHAFLVGGIAVTDTQSAYLEGINYATDNQPAYTKGQDTADASQIAYVQGSSVATGDTPAFLAGGIEVTDSRPCYTHGQALTSDSQSGFTRGSDTALDSQDAYTKGQDTALDSTPAFVQGSADASITTDAYLAGGIIVDSSTSAFIEGDVVGAKDSSPAYTRGLASDSDTTPAYVHGSSDTTGTSSAYVHGSLTVTGSSPAFLKGQQHDLDGSPAYLAGGIEVQDSTDSYTHGGVAVIDTSPAFVHGKQLTTDNQTAFLRGQDSASVDTSAYVQGQSSTTGSTPVYLAGGVVAETSTDGYLKGQDAASVSTDVFLQGQDSATGSVSAFVYGSVNTTDNTSAFVAGDVYEELVPDGDVAVNSWKNEVEGSTLWSSIDEEPYDDDDYVYFDGAGGSEYFEVSLSDPTHDSDGTGIYTIYWRSGKIQGDATIVMKVELRQGAVLIASDEETITGSFVSYEYQLTQGEIDSITDFDDLRLRFIVVSVT